MTLFYSDYGIPEVARLAKAIVKMRGGDPAKLVRETGYPNAPMVPHWWKHQDFALSFLACSRAIAEGIDLTSADDAEMSDPQTSKQREILALLCAKAVAPHTDPATTSFILDAASKMFEPPKWGDTMHVEALDPLIDCLNVVYDAMRLDPSNAQVRVAASALERGIRRLSELNEQVIKRERRRAEASLDAEAASEDQA